MLSKYPVFANKKRICSRVSENILKNGQEGFKHANCELLDRGATSHVFFTSHQSFCSARPEVSASRQFQEKEKTLLLD